MMTNSNSETRGRIDVHHHIVPKEYVEQLKEIGIKDSLGIPFHEWTPEMSLKYMNKLNIETAIMSIFTPGVSFKDNQNFSLKISRWGNEYLAKLKKDNPGKFGGFACIPLDFVEESIKELEYALDKLELEGICLFTNYSGKYLGDESFNDFFNELNKRNAVVFIHPILSQKGYDSKLGVSNYLTEPSFEIIRAITNILYNGITEKYPNIRYILSNGGGSTPYIANRFSTISYNQKNRSTSKLRILYELIFKKEPAQGLKILRNMYYGTAGVSGSPALNGLKEFAGQNRILYGSGFPSEENDLNGNKNLKGESTFSDEDLQKIYYENFLEIFPQLRNNSGL